MAEKTQSSGISTKRPDPDHPSKPQGLSDLEKPTWFGIVKRSFKEFKDDDCTDWAAALTYYGVLALFPAVIVMVALLGVFGNGQDTVNSLLQIFKDLGVDAADTIKDPINQVVSQKSAAGTLLGFGLLGALWSASGYVGAFSRASNAIYEVDEGRKFYKLKPLQLLITAVGLIGITLLALGLVVSGPVAKAIGKAAHVGDGAVTVWGIAKWPVLLVLASLLLSVLYWAAPNVKQPKFRFFTLGGLIALIVWILASAAFGFYVANFGSYNKTYGSLGAVIGFLVWVWITNCAILFGAEVNAEIERGRELQAGMPAEDDMQLPYRDTPKDEQAASDGKDDETDTRDRTDRERAR